MRVTLNLDLHEDFLLTCEVLHVDINEAIKCYIKNVKLFEATHDENNTTEFTATQIFFCVYLYWCLSLERNVDLDKNGQILKALEEIRQLKEEQGLILNSPEYEDYINKLFKKLNINHGKKKNNTRHTK